MQYSARRRIDEEAAKVDRLVREAEARGEPVPPELRDRFRGAVVIKNIQTLRRIDASYLSVGARREILGRRLAEAALPAGLGALLAGAATAGVVPWAGRRRG